MVSTPTRKITKNFLIPPLSCPPELVFCILAKQLGTIYGEMFLLSYSIRHTSTYR